MLHDGLPWIGHNGGIGFPAMIIVSAIRVRELWIPAFAGIQRSLLVAETMIEAGDHMPNGTRFYYMIP